VLRAKYAAPGEGTREEVFDRVSQALAQAEAPALRAAWAATFREAMREGLLPAGRILAGAGRSPVRCLVNCFVQPLGGPRHPEAGPPLAQALAQAVTTLRAGGGVGCDFSAQDDVIGALRAFDATCAKATGRGPRPGALMGVLEIEHPAVDAFIDAKARAGLTHFNLSVALGDGFMNRVKQGEPEARARWHRLVHAAWHHGEPGVLFIDAIRHDDVLGWRETLTATNPCAEQPLPPHGSCCLASVDLARCVVRPLQRGAHLDFEALARLATVAVRLLDNVIELTAWPLPEQAEEARATRRIGLGFTGLADALILLSLRYDRADGRSMARRMVRTLRDAAVRASVQLAAERGPYPLFDAARHLAAPAYASRLPAVLRSLIARHGLRHSHLMSVAPAGSISLALADQASSGIEPVWAWTAHRPVRDAQGELHTLGVQDPAWRAWQRMQARSPKTLPSAFVTAADISAREQLAMVAAVAPYIDASISKTVNLHEDTPEPAVGTLLMQAWQAGLKGLAVYRPNPVMPPLLRRDG